MKTANVSFPIANQEVDSMEVGQNIWMLSAADAGFMTTRDGDNEAEAGKSFGERRATRVKVLSC